MDPSCLVSTIQAGGGGAAMWDIVSWHTLGPLVPIEHHLNTTAYLSIVADQPSTSQVSLIKWPVSVCKQHAQLLILRKTITIIKQALHHNPLC